MSRKSKFRTQKNGRERGLPGMGDGALPETSPLARATKTPSKVEKQRKQEKKEKQQGWD